jgi:hypothetical protein
MLAKPLGPVTAGVPEAIALLFLVFVASSNSTKQDAR